MMSPGNRALRLRGCKSTIDMLVQDIIGAKHEGAKHEHSAQ